MSELKDKAVKGVIWSAIERFAVQGVQFIVLIVMARILSPNDYGLVGMASIFIAISNSLVDSGFSQALIRKQDRTDIDNSTVFYFNILVSIIIYFICFFVAPLVADFYEEPDLTPIVRVLCLITIINSFAIVQRVLFTIKIDFKSQAKASLIAAIISGVVGIYFAYQGFGVWALVWQQIVNAALLSLILWILSKWRPLLTFSWTSFHQMFSFGSKLLASGLIDTAYKEIYTIIVGKLFQASSLGHYSRAKQFTEFPSSNLTNIMQRVTYPILCEFQNDDDKLRDTYRRFLKMSAFIIFPLMIGLAAVSESLINVAIGSKWMFCAQLLQILCFSMMWYPIHAINLNLLQVKGRSDLFLKLEIIKKILGISVIIITAPFGLVVMCYGQIINSIIALIINTYYTGKLINLGFHSQMKDLMPTIIVSMIMFVVVLLLQNMFDNESTKLIVGIVVGIAVFIFMALVFKFRELQDLKSLINKK